MLGPKLTHWKTKLHLDTRSLSAKLKSEFLSREPLLELLGLLDFCSRHLEISVLYIAPNESNTWKFDISSEVDSSELENSFKLIRKASCVFMQLPQSIIFDLGKKIEGPALELSLGADLRIAHKLSQVCFNHLQLGISPYAGGVEILSRVVGLAHTKNWLMSSHPITREALITSGFVERVYESAEAELELGSILEAIKTQSPVARIQTKRMFYEDIAPLLERAQYFAPSISKGSIATEDWKKVSESKRFISAKDWANYVKDNFASEDENKKHASEADILPFGPN